MSDNSSIEWTDATWNPVTGCSVVSPGCTNCYAMGLAGTRLRNHPSRAGLTIDTKAGPIWNGEVRLNEQWLTQPLKWKRPRTIFVCAHGDLFHESVPDEWIDRVFAVMALAPQHTFQVLTKRAKRMREYISANPGFRIRDAMQSIRRQSVIEMSWPLPNVWKGVSAEDQKRADERVPELLATPAAVRFVSAEPLLGPIDFARIERIPDRLDDKGSLKRAGIRINALTGHSCESGLPYQSLWNGEGAPPTTPPPCLDWIIVGGESGPSARPMHPDWPRAIRDACASAGVPFFFKQWGRWVEETQSPDDVVLPGQSSYFWGKSGPSVYDLGKARAGRMLDGRTHDEMPTRSA